VSLPHFRRTSTNRLRRGGTFRMSCVSCEYLTIVPFVCQDISGGIFRFPRNLSTTGEPWPWPESRQESAAP
jgi:hypothetical protein